MRARRVGGIGEELADRVRPPSTCAPAPIRQILFLAHRKGKVKREKSGGNSAQPVCVTPNLRGSSRIVRRFRGIWLKSAQMSKILTGSAWVGMVLLGGMYARGFVISVR